MDDLFWLLFFVYIVYDITYDLNFSIYYIIHFIFFSKKTKFLALLVRMVMLVITYSMKKRKIGGEILLWNMIQRYKNSFYIVNCTWSTWKITRKHHGREDSALNLLQKIRCGCFYSINQTGLEGNKAKDWRLTKQESPQEILIKIMCRTFKENSYRHYCISWK